MAAEIQENVLDPDLRAWVAPEFSTTTEDDRVVSSVMMMGAMQKYFSYGFTLTYGIPAVTLLGERENWVDIQSRLEKLDSWGGAGGFWRAAETDLALLHRDVRSPRVTGCEGILEQDRASNWR